MKLTIDTPVEILTDDEYYARRPVMSNLVNPDKEDIEMNKRITIETPVSEMTDEEYYTLRPVTSGPRLPIAKNQSTPPVSTDRLTMFPHALAIEAKPITSEPVGSDRSSPGR